MNNEFKTVNDGEIISLNHQEIGRYLNLQSNGFADVQIKTEQFAEIITKRLNLKNTEGQSLFKEGISCEVFKFGSTGLRKGRLKAKLVLEFCPDEPTVEEKSPLDDIRQMME
ncbi:MAG: KGK domain-containing protein [Cyanobacteria bacterium P01_D01_bin.116]